MARPSTSFQKRKRELAKLEKRREKEAKKEYRREHKEVIPGGPPIEALDPTDLGLSGGEEDLTEGIPPELAAYLPSAKKDEEETAAR